MQKPNFLCIGAQKSGTTWLHHWFSQREDLYVPSKKELMFFDVEANYRKGSEWYYNFFEDVKKETVIGEVTPGYMWVSSSYPEWNPPSEFRQAIPERIYANLGPNVKIVAILRNPIDRAMSAFMHHKKKNRINESERFFDVAHKFGIVHMGFYYAHLLRYLETFSSNNIHVVSYEEFFSNSEARRDLSKFLTGIADDGSQYLAKGVHRGLGFTRGVNGVMDNQENKIADRTDIEKLTSLYSDDVAHLREQFKIDTSKWHEFKG
ncbi:sulfotransferase domain-containing protein [Chromohalobacter canadensis]|uniref:Sulfotransferase domain-containing protein n=1 Tax=Chromohalobacter canadensis TaxID=141389 RepID=A0ABZ0YBZ0_9GAMM|nr:sulfotransferase domain-containing protein [Chromohalobacter canadensis]MCK0770244.1 sulfotransferase domain-containing protein [Chromohalobacter canadensis]WQH08921.1 sulfotransferase domain-containing protein [Chromohalobacter canadensis]